MLSPSNLLENVLECLSFIFIKTQTNVEICARGREEPTDVHNVLQWNPSIYILRNPILIRI